MEARGIHKLFEEPVESYHIRSLRKKLIVIALIKLWQSHTTSPPIYLSTPLPKHDIMETHGKQDERHDKQMKLACVQHNAQSTRRCST